MGSWNVNNRWFAGFIQGFVTSILVFILMEFLPTALNSLSIFQGVLSNTSVQRNLMTSIFLFNIVLVFFVTLVAGSVYSSITQIYHSPSSGYYNFCFYFVTPKKKESEVQCIAILFFVGLANEYSRAFLHPSRYNTRLAIQILGETIPQTGIFFSVYCLTRGLLGFPMDLLFPNGIWFVFKSWYLLKFWAKTARER